MRLCGRRSLLPWRRDVCRGPAHCPDARHQMMQAEIQQRLQQVFDPRQAGVLAEVIATASGVAALSGEVAALASTVAALAEAQRRTEERVDALAQATERLAEAQRRTEERLAALAEAQRRTEERVDALAQAMERLAEAQVRTEERLRSLDVTSARAEATLARAETRIGTLDGRLLELTYREKAGAYFGPLLRRMRVVAPHTLEDSLEARVSREAFQEVLRLDLLVSGRPRHSAIDDEVWLAVEVSAAIDPDDVARARRRASILRQAGYQAGPGVAGGRLTAPAEGGARVRP